MNFFYEALDPNGQTILGKMEAQDAMEVQQRLLQSGYRPHSIAPNPNGGGNAAAAPPVVPSRPLHTISPSVSNLPVPSVSTNTVPHNAGSVNAQARQTKQTGGMILAGNAAQMASRTRTRPTSTTKPAAAAPKRTDVSTLGGVSTRDQMFFFQQLASLVNSGMTISAALDNLGPRTRNANLSKTAREMGDAAKAGNAVSGVMERYPRIYPEHVVGMVRAGELGGFLEIALAEIAYGYEQNIALYKRAWIPKLMATQALFAIPLGITFFQHIFDLDAAGNLNIVTNLLAWAKDVFLVYLPIAAVIYFGVKFGARRLQLPQFRRFRDGMSLRLPPFGDLQRQVALSNFVRLLGRLYHAGVSPIHAWEGAMNTASNVMIRDRLASSYGLMQSGASFSDAFAATGLFHDSIEQLIVTGQASGQVPEMLDQATAYYDERVSESSKRVQWMMMRYGVLALLILGGGLLCWMTYSYGQAVLNFPKKFLPESE